MKKSFGFKSHSSQMAWVPFVTLGSGLPGSPLESQSHHFCNERPIVRAVTKRLCDRRSHMSSKAEDPVPISFLFNTLKKLNSVNTVHVD